MLALITESVLDIGFGLFWWTAKKTGTIVYNGISYFFYDNDTEQNESTPITMTEIEGIITEKNKKIKELEDKIQLLEYDKMPELDGNLKPDGNLKLN